MRVRETRKTRRTEKEYNGIFYLKLLAYSFFNMFIVFRIDLNILPYYLYLLAFIGLIMVFLDNKFFNKEILTYFAIVGVSIILAIITIFANSTNEFSYVKFLIACFYKLGLGMFSFAIFKKMFGEEATLILFIKSFIVTCLFLLLSTLIFLMFEGLKNFWIGTIVFRNPLIDNGYYYRLSIKGYTGFEEVCVFSLGTLFSAYFMVDAIDSGKSVVLPLISFLLIAAGGLIYGRTSIVTVGLALIYFVFAPKNKKRMLKILLLLFALAVMIIMALYIASFSNEKFKMWFNWAFEWLIDKSADGVGSVGALKDMYRFPTELATYLIGDGQYFPLTGGYYKNIDVGYLRAIYFYGIPGMLLNYASIVYIATCTIKNLCDTKLKYVIGFILADIFIIELKGVMFDTMIYILAVFWLFSIEEREVNYENKCNHTRLQRRKVSRRLYR